MIIHQITYAGYRPIRRCSTRSHPLESRVAFHAGDLPRSEYHPVFACIIPPKMGGQKRRQGIVACVQRGVS